MEKKKWKKLGARYSNLLSFSISHEVFGVYLKKYLDSGYSYRFVVFDPSSSIDYYCLQDEFTRFSELLTDKIIHRDKFIVEKINFFYKTKKKLIERFEAFDNLDLKCLSNRDILKVLNNLLEVYCTFGIFGPLTGQMISEAFVKNLVLMADKYHLDKEKIEKNVNQLIVPTREGINLIEEKALIKIVKEIDRDKKIKKVFLQSREINKIKKYLQINYPQIYNKILKHYGGYCWLPVFIINPAWTMGDFIVRIKDLLKDKRYVEVLRKMETIALNAEREQKKIFNELDIGPKLLPMREVIHLAGEYLSMRTIFGQMLGFANFRLKKLYQEIARRYGVDYTLFGRLTIEELRQFLLNDQKIKKSILQQRAKFTILIYRNKKHYILTGQKAKEFFHKEIKKEKIGSIAIKGAVACRGKAVGRVKIVKKASQIKKVKKGDILVAPMTSVDMIVGIQKAAAIVTDEGSLTCHAAVISREFNLPCIIGTKIATKVLKDGELIEVDAINGKIKKLIN